MKTTTALAVAVGLGALAACNNQAQNNATENLEMNATENMGAPMEMNAENATENMDMNATGNMDMNATETNTATNNAY